MTMIWGGLPYYADDVARIISDTSSTFLKTNENTQIDYINQRITKFARYFKKFRRSFL